MKRRVEAGTVRSLDLVEHWRAGEMLDIGELHKKESIC